MRPIDADALIERLDQTKIVGVPTVGVLKQLVYTAPTVMTTEERIARLERMVEGLWSSVDRIGRTYGE